MFFLHFWNFVLDLIFPIRCVSCQASGEWFCAVCASKIQLNHRQFCPVCWQPSLGGRVCREGQSCVTASPLAGLRVAASYEQNPELASAVKTLKYKFSRPLARNLAEILLRAITQKNYSGERIIVPIPLHPQRLRYRGFNQAELLAREVARALDLPLVELLMRQKNTAQQAKLSRSARLENMLDAFVLRSNFDLKGKTIILIDDVSSTGATLYEAARVLRLAGAEEIWGLVLARG